MAESSFIALLELLILKTIYTHTSHEKEDEFQNIIDGFFLGLINDANGAETHF